MHKHRVLCRRRITHCCPLVMHVGAAAGFASRVLLTVTAPDILCPCVRVCVAKLSVSQCQCYIGTLALHGLSVEAESGRRFLRAAPRK